jgi:DNA polymerase III subunit delta
MSAAVAYLVRGDDPTLVSRAVHDLVSELVGDEDRSLAVEELVEASYRNSTGDYDIGPLVDAAQTPPFLTARRVVVGREVGRFGRAEELTALVRYLEDPLDTTALVVVWDKGPDAARLAPIPKSLIAAVQAAGEVVDTRVGRGKAATSWLHDQIAASGVNLDRAAVSSLESHLGEDRSRLHALLDTLASAFDASVELSTRDIAPYLGEAGDVAPWELTDAIAAGNAATAIDRLHRMQGSGGRHALQILASLHAHYARMLRLDGSEIRDEKAAALALGMKGSTFPAKKALQQTRALGNERIRRAVALLAQADLDVRGATATPDEATVEVLVARLARLHA